MINTDKECVDYARDCVRLAQLTEDPEIRARLLNMAREWMAAAMHEQEPHRPKAHPTRSAVRAPV